jgi:hypothetical protein
MIKITINNPERAIFILYKASLGIISLTFFLYFLSELLKILIIWKLLKNINNTQQ